MTRYFLVDAKILVGYLYRKGEVMKQTVSQQEFLRDAKDQLGLSWKAFAERIGAPESTLKKWVLPSDSGANSREMPSTVWVLVREILEHENLKNKLKNIQNTI